MTRFHLLASVLILSCLSFALPTAPRAAEADGWTDLTTFEVWKGPYKKWAKAESVSLDTKNPKRLTFTPAKDGDKEFLLVNGPTGREPDLLTKENYGDIEFHVEFYIAKGSNSGVKFHGHYELQIADSHDTRKKLTGSDCGGVYPRAELKPAYHHIDDGIAPKENAAKPAGEWQTLDAIFVAPRFNDKGEKTADAKLVKVMLNGTLIHENVDLKWPTGHNWHNKELATGPILLQGDHGPVAFRNVRVRPYKVGK
jgi:Domain of Unknown Function (DUF1080)